MHPSTTDSYNSKKLEIPSISAVTSKVYTAPNGRGGVSTVICKMSSKKSCENSPLAAKGWIMSIS